MNGDKKLVTITIDGQEVQVPAGTLVVEAARQIGIEIPVFCYHPKLTPVGMCRMCLGRVGTVMRDRETGEIQRDEAGNPVVRWFPKLQTTCTTYVSDGLVVETDCQEVADARRAVIEFLLTSHPLDCPVCDKGGECPLQDLTYSYGPGRSRFDYEDKFHFEKPVPLGPLVALDRERCIFCARCTRFQEEIAGDPVLGFENRGRGMEIVTYSDPPFASKFSGNTTDICPVGALTSRDFRFRGRVWELTNTQSICPHCAVGCNIIIGHRAGTIRRIMPRENNAVNEIWICDKGRFGHHFVGSAERLTRPLVRKKGELVEVEWVEALETVAQRLRTIRDAHGPDAVGGISGDRVSNEDLYVFQRFMRTVIGTNNVDHWREPWDLMPDELVASFGVGSGTNLMDLGAGDAILLIGADPEEEAPLLMIRLKQASERGAHLVVANGRPTKLARFADRDLRVRYGAEVHLALGLLRVVLDEGLLDADFVAQRVEGLEELRSQLASLDLASAAQATGLSEEVLWETAHSLAGAENLIVVYGREAMLSGAGRQLVRALANLLLVTGHVGRANNGLLPVLRHNNSHGAADMGVHPLWLPGYMPVEDAQARGHYAAVWGVELPATPGLDAQAMLNGGVRALFLLGTDPVAERPDLAARLRAMDFVVVQDVLRTETAQQADVVLPAAAFAERDGTFTNTERRVQLFRKAFDPPGLAHPDWALLTDLAHLLGQPFPYGDVEDVMNEIARVVPIYEGMEFPNLEAQAPFGLRPRFHFIYEGTSFVAPSPQADGRQWPVRAEQPDARFVLHPVEVPELAEAGDKYPFLLIPQKRLYDDGTLIERSRILEPLVPFAFAILNVADAEALGVEDGQRVVIRSPEGAVELVARVSGRVPRGIVLIPLDLDGAVVRELGIGQRLVQGRVEPVGAAEPVPVSD